MITFYESGAFHIHLPDTLETRETQKQIEIYEWLLYVKRFDCTSFLYIKKVLYAIVKF